MNPTPQLQMLFDPVHHFENNPESQAMLEEHRGHFTKECWHVLVRMLQGEEITNQSGVNSGISDIRRRAKDLRDPPYNLPIQRENIYVDGKKLRTKKYYIKREDIPAVMWKIINGLSLKTN